MISLLGGCMKFRNHSKVFLLDSSPAPVLELPQLHDMQQLLQLYMLVPNALVQWVADLSDSSMDLESRIHHECVCEHGLNTALCFANMYPRCAMGPGFGLHACTALRMPAYCVYKIT
jgi:hypothetical protein